MLAELLTTLKDWIVQYHEHDSLLENKLEEELTEDERKAAWEEYEQEKKGLRLPQRQFVHISLLIDYCYAVYRVDGTDFTLCELSLLWHKLGMAVICKHVIAYAIFCKIFHIAYFAAYNGIFKVSYADICCMCKNLHTSHIFPHICRIFCPIFCIKKCCIFFWKTATINFSFYQNFFCMLMCHY